MDFSQLSAGVDRCCRALWGAGHEACPVGGCVRDLLLGRRPLDFDVATSALPEQVLALFPGAVPTGLRHGTVTLPDPGGDIEITTFRAEEDYSDARHPDRVRFGVSLERDLERRDFTVNAMALDRDGSVIDLFGGRADLEARVLRCVGEPDRRFREDALRMFRAVRFAAQLDFTLEEGVVRSIRRNAPRCAALSAERVRAEVERTLLSPRPGLARAFFTLGLMARWAPGTPGPLDGLAALAAEPLLRWAGLCGALLDAGAVADAGAFLTALRLDGRTARACAGGEALRRSGLPEDARGWRRALARCGGDACRAAAAMEGADALARLDALLAQRPCVTVGQLALSGGELARLGYAGPEIGEVQRRLLAHVLDRPEDNRPERLLELLQGPKAGE